LAVSIRDLGDKTGNAKLVKIADALDAATPRLLNENKSPLRKVGQLDNRGSHYWLARYWAQELAGDADLGGDFAPLAQALSANEQAILSEIDATQGTPADLGGYYRFDDAKAAAAMRPSATLNDLIAA
jgi:isocitrate dehydrogenase